MLDGFPTRAAWALCTFAYSAGPGTQPVLFEGRTDGKIVPARGPATFGWDPVFEAEGTGLTYVFVLILFSIQLLPPTPPFSSHIYLFSRTEGADTWRCDVLVPFFFLVAATRRWRRHKRTPFPTGDEHCRSCVITCKRPGWSQRSARGFGGAPNGPIVETPSKARFPGEAVFFSEWGKGYYTGYHTSQGTTTFGCVWEQRVPS